MVENLIRADVESELKEIVSGALDIEASGIYMNSMIERDLGGDSMHRFEIGFLLEQRYGVTIPDEFMSFDRAVGDYAKYVTMN